MTEDSGWTRSCKSGTVNPQKYGDKTNPQTFVHLNVRPLAHATTIMPDEKNPNDTQLKLYGMLVDQLQKYTTILWQFPTALLAANAFAIDKFHSQPWMLLALGAADGVLTFAFHRLVIQQRAIITATRAAEDVLRQADYPTFIPKFSAARVRAPFLIVCTLWALTAALFIFSFITIYCHVRPAAIR